MAPNATYSLKSEIAGLANNIGDRKLEFSIQLPGDNQEVANEVWYLHMSRMFGCIDDDEDAAARVNRIGK